MSGTVKTAAQLYTEFADGQAIGAIVPGDVRDIIASVGSLAATNTQTPILELGAVGAAITVDPTQSHLQSLRLTTGGNCTISIGPGNEVANTRIRMELYVVQNSSGTGVVIWGSGISYGGPSPQVSNVANSVTLFNIVSLDGGATWSIV
jgi:hypothetical protein